MNPYMDKALITALDKIIETVQEDDFAGLPQKFGAGGI